MENREKQQVEDDVNALKEKSQELKNEAGEAFDNMKTMARHKLHMMQKRADIWRREAEGYAKDNVWKSVGIAALAGLIIGMLIGKRGGDR